MVGWLPRLKHCNGETRALGERKARKTRRGSCPLCERVAGVRGALSVDR